MVGNSEAYTLIENQVTPFYIDTEDGEKIFAWHVLPLGLYARHRDELVEEPTGVVKEFVDSKALQLIRNDPEARLVIHCKPTLIFNAYVEFD